MEKQIKSDSTKNESSQNICKALNNDPITGLKSFVPPSAISPVTSNNKPKTFNPPASGINPLPVQKKSLKPVNNLSVPAQMKLEEEGKKIQLKKSEEEKPAQLMKDEDEKLQMKKTDEEEKVQLKSNKSQSYQFKPDPAAGNKSLPDPVRMKMENGFGADFSNVKITESSSAKDMGALAYTQGNNIHFAPGKFNPESKSGQELLGHELAHVVQQRQGKVQPTTQFKGLQVNDDVGLEKEADDAGKKVAEGQKAEVKKQSSFEHIQQKAEVGSSFETYIQHVKKLEAGAISDGYSLTQRVTAFRKIYYDSKSAAKQYAGATVGGGVWNILIPGAANTALPSSWSTAGYEPSLKYLASNKEIAIGGKQVDIGHLLTGLDAHNNPTSLSLAGGLVKMSSNKEAVTFVGDLGSIVGEYIMNDGADEKGKKQSFYDVAMKKSQKLLEYYYQNNMKEADINANTDSYAMTLDNSKSLADNIYNYYSSSNVDKRYTLFAKSIGMIDSSRKLKSGYKQYLKDEVFNAAQAYVAGKGRKSDLINIHNDPGPGLFSPTFWEMYFNVSGWVVDMFVDKIIAEASNEK